MPYYLALHPDPSTDVATIWTLDDKLATRVDARQVERVLSGTPPNVAVENLPGFTFFRLKLAPGEFYRARDVIQRIKCCLRRSADALRTVWEVSVPQ